MAPMINGRQISILFWLLVALAGLMIVFGSIVEANRVANLGTTSGATYLLEEDMEGTGTPSGWSDTGTVNWDDTTNNITGAKSWSAGTGTSNNSTSPSFTATSPCYAFHDLTIGAASGNSKIFILRGSTSAVAELEYRSTGVLRIHCGSSQAQASISSGTWYVWHEYTAGTGSDATYDLYWSSTTTKPGSPNLSITDGTSTESVVEAKMQGHANTTVIDTLRVDDVSIGSSPP